MFPFQSLVWNVYKRPLQRSGLKRPLRRSGLTDSIQQLGIQEFFRWRVKFHVRCDSPNQSETTGQNFITGAVEGWNLGRTIEIAPRRWQSQRRTRDVDRKTVSLPLCRCPHQSRSGKPHETRSSPHPLRPCVLRLRRIQ